MKSVSELYNLVDHGGEQHSFSKMIAFTVVIGDILLVALGVVDNGNEATVLSVLTAGALGLDWGKNYLKQRNGASSE